MVRHFFFFWSIFKLKFLTREQITFLLQERLCNLIVPMKCLDLVRTRKCFQLELTDLCTVKTQENYGKNIMFLSLQRVHPNCERCPRSICAGLALRHGPVIPCSVCAVGMSTKENLATSVPSSKNEHSERRAVVHWGVYVVERDRSLQDCSFTAKKPEQGVCVWHQVLACSLPPGVEGLCILPEAAPVT